VLRDDNNNGLVLQSRVLALGSPLVFQLWHHRDFVSRALVYRNGRYHGPNLIFGLALSFLQEIPERIDNNVIAGSSLVLLGPADLTDPAYSCPVFGCEANRGPASIVRDVLLSRAHGSDCY
jgi:hypothetical protein